VAPRTKKVDQKLSPLLVSGDQSAVTVDNDSPLNRIKDPGIRPETTMSANQENTNELDNQAQSSFLPNFAEIPNPTKKKENQLEQKPEKSTLKQMEKDLKQEFMKRHTVAMKGQLQATKGKGNSKNQRDTLEFNKALQDYQQVLSNTSKWRKNKKPIKVTLKVGKKETELQFDSKKQLDKFIETLQKNNSKANVFDKKGNSLYKPEDAQQKKGKNASLDQVQIFDGSMETGKILNADQNVADFNSQYLGAAELVRDYEDLINPTPEQASAPEVQTTPESAPKAEKTHEKNLMSEIAETWENILDSEQKPDPEPAASPTNNPNAAPAA